MTEYFEIQYKGLAIVGVRGNMEKRLSDVIPIIKQRHPLFEIAPIQRQIQYRRNFLAMFMDKPPRDITMDQDLILQEASVLGLALDRKILTETIENMIEAIGFVPIPMNTRTAAEWEIDFEHEKMSYDMCESVSQTENIPLESLWGAPRYATLLIYRGFPEKEAKRLAGKRFNLPLD